MSWSSLTTMQKPARRGPKPPVPRLRLLWAPTSEPLPQPADVLTPGAEVVVGRQVEGRDVLLPDARASRRHARLEVDREGSGIRLVDTSSNGTNLNGVRVQEAELADGDVIRMGDSFLLLRWTPAEVEDAVVDAIAGDAPSVCELRRDVSVVAPSDATVLVLGESGTGKELVARAVHSLSGRAGRFVAVNCGAIPEALAESQLFGHVRGAFTGADRDHEGYFRAARGGTLFLDEIGELPVTVQAKLLRALEERTVVPVGTTTSLSCDVRVVAATHQDLQARVDDGAFRGDLYARLAEIIVRTPPLRDHREDILPLLAHEVDLLRLDADLVEALLTWEWPYNVRELLKVGRELEVRGAGRAHLTLELVRDRLTPRPPGVGLADETVPATAARPARATKRERPRRGPPPTRDELDAILRQHRGNISAISRATGRSRKQVYRWLDEMGLTLDDYRDA